MKTIYLLGELGKKFGRKHRFDVKSPAEAVRAMVANFPGFERHMIESGDRGVGYHVLAGATPIGNYDDIHKPTAKQESIRFVPTLTGAGGNGITGVLLGVALIAASFIPGLNVAVWAGASATFASVAFGLGVSLALGGISQMLTPTPKTSDSSSANKAENSASYVFNGAVNVTAQGNPVPIGYGRLIVGSAVISAGIVTEEIPVGADVTTAPPATNWPSATAPDNGTPNPGWDSESGGGGDWGGSAAPGWDTASGGGGDWGGGAAEPSGPGPWGNGDWSGSGGA